jgi:chemotaxis protein MotA
MKNALMLVIDSVEPEKIKQVLETELDYLEDRHSQAQGFYMKMAEFAPAFGMAGTLIGLINLLANMSDADALAANMAVALVTTFYGVIMANLMGKPVANKLKKRHEEEMLCKVIISEGVQSIQDGDNPQFIEEKLMRLLPSKTGQKGGKKDKEK